MTNPSTTGLIKPWKASPMNSPSTTAVQYVLDPTPSLVTEISHPAPIPKVSAITVRTGAISVVAMTRGTTSLRSGSVPRARSALTWSVTTIDPSSAAMPDPTRPANISAVSTGPSSRIIEALTSRPTSVRAPN